MPIYEYVCNACGEGFALLQRVGSTEKESACPKCGSYGVRRTMSAFSCCSGNSGSGFSPSSPSTGFGGGG